MALHSKNAPCPGTGPVYTPSIGCSRTSVFWIVITLPLPSATARYGREANPMKQPSNSASSTVPANTKWFSTQPSRA